LSILWNKAELLAFDIFSGRSLESLTYQEEHLLLQFYGHSWRTQFYKRILHEPVARCGAGVAFYYEPEFRHPPESETEQADMLLDSYEEGRYL
jgi:hypothetical protein